jgi:hypothetical protein
METQEAQVTHYEDPPQEPTFDPGTGEVTEPTNPEQTREPEPSDPPTSDDGDKEPKLTLYVVLAAENVDGPYSLVGTYEVESGGDARGRARKAAVEARSDLKERISEGEQPIWLVAGPRASFQPKQAGVKRTEVLDV